MNMRDRTFDIAKGIGIICMLLGHEPKLIGDIAQQVIYTFHMPLFFILAGYFTHIGKISLLEDIKHSGRRLLLPYFFTFFLLLLWGILQTILKHNIAYCVRPVLSCLYGSRDLIESKFGAISVGAFWFVLGLFWAKIIFLALIRYTNKYTVMATSAALSIFSIVLYRLLHFSLWSILPGVSGLIFIAIGWWYKNYGIPNGFVIVSIICWPIAYFSDIDMSVLFYKCYPIDVLGACGGTYCIVKFSKWICSIHPKSLIGVSWCGEHSMTILSFHVFEILSAIAWSMVCRIPFTIEGNEMILFRYIVMMAMVYICVNFKFTQKIYG